MDHTPQQIASELRRIGVDERRLGPVAVGGVTADALLRWIRWLPTALGHDEFVRRLERWADDGGLKTAMGEQEPPSTGSPGADGEPPLPNDRSGH